MMQCRFRQDLLLQVYELAINKSNYKSHYKSFRAVIRQCILAVRWKVAL